jgi:hypothetical protein
LSFEISLNKVAEVFEVQTFATLIIEFELGLNREALKRIIFHGIAVKSFERRNILYHVCL